MAAKIKVWDDIELKLKARTLVDTETGCWLWQGAINNRGYGHMFVNSRYVTVHRLSAFIYHGLDLTDEKMNALHKDECPNKNCWNPEHVFTGTHSENMRGRILTKKTHCKRGHEFTEENTYVTSQGKRICRECDKMRHHG